MTPTEVDMRGFVKQLWEDTEYDKAAREFIFGDVIDALEAAAEEMADAREDEIRDEVRDDVKEDLIEDPPHDLVARVTETLIDDPPTPLVDKIKASIREEMEKELADQRDDLRAETTLLIEDLEEQIDRLKKRLGNEQRAQSPQKGTVWR